MPMGIGYEILGLNMLMFIQKERILTTLLTRQCFHWVFLNCKIYSRLTSSYYKFLAY